jgi:hypothetical protein
MADKPPAPSEGQGSQDRKTPPIPDVKQGQGGAQRQSPSTGAPSEGQGSQDRTTPEPG